MAMFYFLFRSSVRFKNSKITQIQKYYLIIIFEMWKTEEEKTRESSYKRKRLVLKKMSPQAEASVHI